MSYHNETYGEMWFRIKSYQNKSQGLDDKMSGVCMPQRMGYADAIKYYKNKFRNYFAEIATLKDFDSVADYYDFHNANMLLNAFYESRERII